MTEQRIVSMVAVVGSVLPMIPTGWAVGTGVVDALDWPASVGIAAGVGLELFGLGAMLVALSLYSFNRDPKQRRQSDPKAPTWIALVLVSVYAVAAVTLAVLIQIYPQAADYAPAIFVPVSVCAAGNLALIADHARRRAAIAADRAKRSKSRASQSKPEQEPEQEPNNDEQGPNSFICSECGYEAKSQLALNGHMNKHKKKGEQK